MIFYIHSRFILLAPDIGEVVACLKEPAAEKTKVKVTVLTEKKQTLVQ